MVDERFQDRMRRERADAILREASTLAAEQGWAALRVEDVAQRAGIAKGTVYLDFKDKDDLVAAAMRRSMGEIVDAMRDAASGAGDDRLGASLRVLGRLPVDRPDLVALLRFTRSDPQAPPGALDDVERYLKRLIRTAQAEGSIDEAADPEFVAQAVVAAITVPAWSRLAKREQGSSGLLLRLVFTIDPNGRRSRPLLPSPDYSTENSDSTVG